MTETKPTNGLLTDRLNSKDQKTDNLTNNRTTVLFRTTLTQTATQYELLILLGSNHLLIYTGGFRRSDAKSEVKSRDECVIELDPTPGMVIPSLWTSHPFNHFHSVLYRTQNCLFSSIWYQVIGPWESLGKS